MGGITVSARDVERTSTIVTAALWGIALVAMIGSATNSWTTFSNFHAHPVHGVITALTVDASLAVWLHIRKRLHDADITSQWGHVHEWVTAGMTAYLNAGAALFLGLSKVEAKLPLTIAYCFIPATLILSCLTFGDALSRLRRNRRDREATEQAERDAKLAADQAAYDTEQRQRVEDERRRANGELVDAADVLTKARESRQEAERERRAAVQDREEAAQLRADLEAEVAATEVAKAKLAARSSAVSNTTKPTQKRRQKPSTPDERRKWTRDYLNRVGHLPIPAAVNSEFGTADGWRIVSKVRDELQTEIDKERGLHLVESGGVP